MAYTRTYIDTVEYPAYAQYTTGDANGQTSISTAGSVLPGVEKYVGSRSGQAMPDWRNKIRNGLSASTPYTLDRTKVVSMALIDPKYVLTYETRDVNGQLLNWYRYAQEGIGFRLENPVVHLSASQSIASSKALTKVYKKITSEMQQMSAPAFFAEFFDVVRQFGHPFEAIVNLMDHHVGKMDKAHALLFRRFGFNRSDFSITKKARTPPKAMKESWLHTLASTHLEISFGLKPLLSDAEAAAETLARYLVEQESSPTWRRRIVCRAEDVKATTVVNGPYSFQPSNSHQDFLVHNKKVTTALCQYVVGLKAPPRAPPGSLERLAELYGVTPANILPAAYQAIPWSWLNDYFNNFSDIIDAIFTSTASVDWIVKTDTLRTELYGLSQLLPMKNNFGGAFVTGTVRPRDAGSVKIVRTTLNRTIPTTLGIPSLYFEHPFGNDGKIANMAAVLFSKKAKNVALSDFMSASSPTIHL